jgi:hypothetical protein
MQHWQFFCNFYLFIMEIKLLFFNDAFTNQTQFLLQIYII